MFHLAAGVEWLALFTRFLNGWSVDFFPSSIWNAASSLLAARCRNCTNVRGFRELDILRK